MLEYYPLWTCLGAFVAFYAIRIAFEPREMFAPPLLLSLLLFGIFVKSYFEFEELVLAVYLDPDGYQLTMLYACICLLLFCFLYDLARKMRVKATSRAAMVEGISDRTMTAFVAVFGMIGMGAQWYVASQAGGLVAYYSSAHGSAVDVTDMSAYIYSLTNFMWPAFLLGVIRLVKNRWYMPLLAVTCVIGAALFAHTFLFGNRNGIIRFCILIGGTYAFIKRPSIAKSLPLLAFLALGVAAVLIVGELRNHLHLGAETSLSEAIAERSQGRAPNEAKHEFGVEYGGHELFFNVAVLQASWLTGQHGNGIAYVWPIISFVPRAWWPGKPTDSTVSVDFFRLVENTLGWSPGKGGAINAVGQSFLELSWYGCLVWALLGFACGRIFQSAMVQPNTLNIGSLMACLLAVIFWGTQSFYGVFFAWFYTIIPFYALSVYTRFIPKPVMPAPPRSARPRAR